MKLFAAITIMLGFSMMSKAQTADMTATAAVVNALAVTVTQPLNFGNILKPSGSSVTRIVALDDQATGSATAVAGVTPKHGIFKIVKGANTNLSVTYTAIAGTLTGAGAPMAMSGYVSKCNINSTDGSTGVDVSCVALAPTSITTLTAATDIYVHIGGTVTAADAQLAGVYTGTITLQATYN